MNVFRPLKFLPICVLLLTSFLLVVQAYGQLPKKERRVWKKELRKLSPEEFKSMVDEKTHLRHMVDLLSEENSNLKTKVYQLEQSLVSREEKLRKVANALKALEIQLGLVNEKGERWDKGVVFKVQIGALNKEAFEQVPERSYTMEVEEDISYKQYVVGNFRDYNEADLLKKHMRKVGVRRAWIVPYKDGKRVPLKEVLDVVTLP